MNNEYMSNPHCRVCGLEQCEAPWGEDNKTPNYTICDCCGTEFGYHDFSQKAIFAQREKWIYSNYKWKYPEHKPKNWSAEEQIKNIPEEIL